MTELPRILAVDDEPRGVELVARALRKVGRVEIATSGEAGWEIAQRGPLDLVISDQRMPGMSGVELLTRVADRGGETGRILLTGYSDIDATIDAVNLGRVHAYLNKPCPPDQLRTTAASVLEQVRLARENRRLVGELRETNEALEDLVTSLRTAQRRVVETERLSAIGSMIASIVHDFRGPLTVITANGRELGGEPARDAENVRDLAGDIVAEAERMSRMCAELLDVTRVSSGQARRVVEEVGPVLESAFATLAHDASLAGVEIRTELEPGLRFALDADRFRRIVLNMGYNAIEAMPDGGVLRVSAAREGGELVIAIADTGVGVPEDVRNRLFEPFVTAGKATGSGLGLAVAKRVVDEHDGSIEFGKPEGGGTVFRLRFPLAEAS